MSQLDDPTLVFFCFLGFVIVASLTVCGVFAIAEFLYQRRKRAGRHLRYLQRAVRRCTLAPEPAGRPAGRESISPRSAAAETDAVL